MIIIELPACLLCIKLSWRMQTGGKGKRVCEWVLLDKMCSYCERSIFVVFVNALYQQLPFRSSTKETKTF